VKIPRDADELPAPLAIAILASIATLVFVIRLTGLPNLLDNEYRLGATVLNVLHDGNWVCPHDALGNTDKPPLLTWLSALVSAPFGGVNRFTLYLPTALATLALSWIVFVAGRGRFGWRAGYLGALAYLLSVVGSEQMATARWDGLFALTVALVALAAFRAWMSGNGWVWFWLAAAASTLLGPLGLVLGSLGLGASAWERFAGSPKPVRGAQLGGIAVFLVITGGWLLLAYRQVGWPLIDNMIGKELLGHVVEHEPAQKFWKPVGDFLANFGPWSVFTCLAAYEIWKTPTRDDSIRRFERFLVCWFVGGLLIFSLSPHNPARLLWPIVPPAAILAGRELRRLTARVQGRTLAGACGVVALVAVALSWLQCHVLIGKDVEVRETLAIQQLSQLVPTVVTDTSAAHVDTPYALQPR
jgi:4-amino-4-deoxy-L-arabinose transferase-like glycosyltransferase